MAYTGTMSDESQRTVQMALVNHGEAAPDGDFTFSMQPRFNPARTVKYALIPSEAEALHKALGAYLRQARKAQ